MFGHIVRSSVAGLMALALSLQASAGENFIIRGSLSGLPDSVRVTLADIEDPNGEVVDLAQTFTSGGTFSLSGEVGSPKMCSLSFSVYSPKSDEYRRAFSIPVMVERGVEMVVGAPVSYDSLRNTTLPERLVKVDGGEAQRVFNAYIASTGDARLKAKNASYLNAKKYFASNADPDTMAKYEALVLEAEAVADAMRADFIKENPASDIAAYLTQRELEKPFVYTADEINAMADLVKACPDTARISTVERRRKFALKYALRRNCPEFDVTHPDGKVVDFASLLSPGKFTFIDFWASWCGPCRSAIPHVRELNQKYAGRLNVYSVSLDNSDDAWRKALDEEKMEWAQFHVSEDQMNRTAQAFFITTIPRLILLNDKGEVICSTNKPDVVTACLANHLGE